MALLDIKGKAQAEAWKRKLAGLNDETEMVLRDVYTCIQEIKDESEGEPVEQLILTAAEMADAAADVIKGLRALEDAIEKIIQALAAVIAEGIQSVLGKRDASTNL